MPLGFQLKCNANLCCFLSTPPLASQILTREGISRKRGSFFSSVTCSHKRLYCWEEARAMALLSKVKRISDKLSSFCHTLQKPFAYVISFAFCHSPLWEEASAHVTYNPKVSCPLTSTFTPT
jgi:hypothetical protein